MKRAALNRLLVAHTPLGDDWWITSLKGAEALSALFVYTLLFKSEKYDLDMQALLGEACSVAIAGEGGDPARHISGHVIGATALGRIDRHWHYELQLAPKLWFAGHRADYRIFQHQTVREIATQILQQNAVLRYDWRLKNTYKTWEYIVQYGESDLGFLKRLLGHEGQYFWFEHGPEGETLILGDHFSVHDPFVGYETIPYHPLETLRHGEDHFNGWRARRVPQPGRFVQTAYDPRYPSYELETESHDPRGHLFDQYEIFNYPGAYGAQERDHGREYAAARLAARQLDQNTLVLEGGVRGALPGQRFTLTNHPVASHNREWTITHVEFEARNNDYVGTQHTEGQEAGFRATVTVIPADQQYRAPSTHYSMPRAFGPDTAVVVGPEGSEIHTDEYGRIKVHFHWDRYGKRDGQDSCWIRVASPWAGTSTGTISIPRVGQEVVIQYENADPQSPMVIASVYNAQQTQPWKLPANKTQSGFKTHSTPGGGAENFNALCFENAKGREEVWLHAEKDQRIEVENDESHTVDHDRTKTIGNDETVHVKHDRAETVDNNETIAIGVDRTERVGHDESVNIGNDRTVTIGGNKTETVAMAKAETIGLAKALSIGGAYQTTVGAAMNTTVALAHAEQVGLSKSVVVGKDYAETIGDTYTLTAGGVSNITMDKDTITLKVGKSVLVMKADGTVQLNGKKLDLVGSEHIQLDSKRIDLN